MSRVDLLKQNLSNIVRVEDKEEILTILDNLSVLDEPLPIRKAKALALLLREAPVHIYPKELIVGIPFREEPAPDVDNGTILRRLPPENISGKGYIDDARRRIALGLSNKPYSPIIQGSHSQTGSSRYALFPHYATEEERTEASRFGLHENSNPGHLQTGHARVVAFGWSGLKEMARERLAKLDTSTDFGNKRAIFLRSVIIALDGAQDFALRYSDLAKEMAGKEEEPHRRDELVRISEICRRVAVEPPQTFWEALQLHWFTHIISLTQDARQLGRFDQYMYPFLKRDLREKKLTKKEAQELLECLWIKYNTLTDMTMDNLQNMIFGGQNKDGRDATNMLSYMCMEATSHLGLIDPKWSIRVHSGTPDHFLRKACEIIKTGKYQPGVYNDEAIIPALMNVGVPLEDARDYTNDGCSEILIQGKSNPWAFEAKINLLKCLELITNFLDDYETFEKLVEALKKEIKVAVEMAVANANLIQAAVPQISPNPFISATVEGCIEKMIDLTEGGAKYNFAGVCASAVADTADALAAMKKLVFEERQIGKRELLDTLERNFEGRERLRLMLLNRAPKFGNDDDYVDSLAAELVEYTAKEVRKHSNPRKGEYILGLFSYGEYIGYGLVTRATPDGRRDGEWISPNFSPSPGRDMNGPFAVLKSTTKVNQLLTANGTALDITLHPSALIGPQGVETLMNLITCLRDLRGMQAQFNIVNAEVLKNAQKEPNKYRSLTVRVWGFPAYFVRLPREFQENIIARTEHKM